MRRVDIRQVKRDLRDKYKDLRRAMSPEQKREADRRIRERVLSTYQYKGAAMLLTYVSTAIEVDTREIIRQAWADGKTVCVPRCREGERLMDFYEITSFDQLEKGAFCIVPGLGFDHFGFRLGYGKGYYDRFLSRYDGFKVGICYNECISHRLPRGRYDVPIDLLATPRFLKRPFRG